MKFLKLYEEFIEEGKIVARVGGVPIELKIASTEDEMKRGYMFSDGPSDGQGMLFVYQTEQILNFWMKNVSIPLDILFFDSNMNLVDYQSMYPYEDDEEIHYHSKLPAKFAIEVPYGWISMNVRDESIKLEF